MLSLPPLAFLGLITNVTALSASVITRTILATISMPSTTTTLTTTTSTISTTTFHPLMIGLPLLFWFGPSAHCLWTWDP